MLTYLRHLCWKANTAWNHQSWLLDRKSWFIVLDCSRNRVDRPSLLPLVTWQSKNPLFILEITIFLSSSFHPFLSGENSVVQETTWLYHVVSARSLLCLVRVICSSSFLRRKAQTEKHIQSETVMIGLISAIWYLKMAPSTPEERRKHVMDVRIAVRRGMGQRSMCPTCRAARIDRLLLHVLIRIPF